MLLNPFISIWLGKNYELELLIPISLTLSFFIEGLRNPGYTYRTTLGLFKKARSTPYIGAITNIFFSVLLCKIFGVAGIFMATSIAQLVSYFWIDPYLIHKYEFNTSSKKYFKRCIIYFLVFFMNMIISLVLANFINFSKYADFSIKILIVCSIPNIINILIFKNTDEFKAVKQKIINPITKKIKNIICGGRK